MSEVAELLYHTTLTVIDYHVDSSGSKQTVFVLGTHSSLEAAKAFSKTALEGLGYQPDDFATYEVHQPGTEWTHGDGVIVYAKAPNGQEFLVGIDTKPNDGNFAAGPDGSIILPKGVDHLHYVLQTKIDYEQDRSGAYQTTEIEGCYAHREEAVKAAKRCLEGEGTEFAQYDERDSPAMEGEWPFGEDVLVHAVAQTGENYLVAVRTIPGAHKKHSKAAKKE